MVKERNNGYTAGTAQNASALKPPQKSPGLLDPDRRPLANISAKMQSSSPKDPPFPTQEAGLNDILSIPEFGKASPLRNPLRKPQASIFIPKPRTFQKPTAAPQTSNNATARPPNSQFHLPGQRPVSATSSSLAFMQDYDDDRAPSKPQSISMPTNQPVRTVAPAPKPVFSSAGSTYIVQTHAPTSMNRTNAGSSDDPHDEAFDLDAAVREESTKFGAPDPYMYMDSSRADENLKNLLEGAFDDEGDKPRTKLRKRATKAAAERDTSVAQSLAAKLADLSVETEKHNSQASGEEEDEEDDGTVEGLNVKLLPHQVDGVSWMIEKESGGSKKRKGTLPHGGILADDMGLGKTVQSVALILTNARPALDAKPEHPNQKLPGKNVGKGTLVVAPLALIKQWESEIKTKVAKSHSLSVLVHHGPNRTKSPDKLKKYDVVITTYQTLTSEHAGSNMDHAEGAKIGCFGVHWYRIMLDEAHSIKNRNAKSSQACCALNSWNRWCLTGTPMQNNLDELQSLIKFLRVKPLCEVSEWKEQITVPMKNGRGGTAIIKVRSFLRAIMKRRTKDILKEEGALNFGGIGAAGDGAKQDSMQIVKREIITVDCEFDEAEQEFYDSLQARADARLDAFERAGETNYMGALVLLLRLRQVCDHPNLIEQAMLKDRDAISLGPVPQSQGPSTDMDDLTALMGGISVQSRRCEICQVGLSSIESNNGGTRCEECQTMLRGARKGKSSKKSKKVRVKKENSERKREKTASRKRHHLPDDSDEEGEGEWIADGPEQRVKLGKAGGSDDEDAEGGGESLNSIDSDRSDDDDDDDDETDSPSRARSRKSRIKSEPRASDSSEEDEESISEEDDDDEDSSSDDSNILDNIQIGSVTSKHKPSTKVRHLLRILHAETPEHKTIVFSQFTSMLDLIEPHLKASNLRFVRYDGSMRNDAREAALHSLRTDKRTRVLLCSLKCGSLGLNLTAASRVVILEPFWNPFVEEQAIDRVHRLNQTVDVKVYKLTVTGTVEQRILELQEKKRDLAEVAIEGGQATNKLGLQDILKLFGREGQRGEHTAEDKVMWEKFGETPSQLRTKEDVRSHKPGKQRLYQEHDVYGRRW